MPSDTIYLSGHAYSSDFVNVYDSFTRSYTRGELIKIVICVSFCSMRPDSGYPTPCRTLRRCNMWTTSLTCWNSVHVKTQVRHFLQCIICMSYYMALVWELYLGANNKLGLYIKQGEVLFITREMAFIHTFWRL